MFSITSALRHLKLYSSTRNGNEMFNGHYLRHFILTSLPLLNDFEFFFAYCPVEKCNPVSLQSLIDSFRTSFWLEEKQWFVTCDYIISLNTIRLYSLPLNMNFFDK